jgi:hypothetical protein
MKYTLSFISVVFFLLLATVSCQTRKPLEPVIVEHTTEITKVVKDTIFKVEADSSFFKAYIECINGKPVIIKDSIIDRPGKNVEVPRVVLKDNFLNVDCKQKALELFKTWRETYIKEQKPVIVDKPVYVEKPFKWYHKTLMWAGGIFLLLSALGIVLKFTLKY